MSLPRIFKSVKPQNLMTAFLILLVVALVNIAALYASSQATHIQGPQPQTMRRESGPVQIGSLAAALDISLRMGDGRKVDFTPFGLEV